MIDKIWVCYILRCNDNTLYCGITNDLDARIKKHNANKGAKYTRGRTPVILLKYFECLSKSDALKKECSIKKLSHNDKLKLCDL